MPNLHDITAVILAGGLGTRLRAVVPDRPKVIAEVRGRPFVTYVMDQLVPAGIRSVVLCTGYMADLVEQCLGTGYRGMRLRYSREDTPLGTGGALGLAAALLESDAALVLNGDSYCPVDLDRFAAQHRQRRARATIVLTATSDTRRYGRVELAEEDRILGFVEKGSGEGPGWVNAGIYLIEADLLRSIPPRQPQSIERDLFPRWIAEGLYGYRTTAPLWDIGVPESFALAQTAFLPDAG